MNPKKITGDLEPLKKNLGTWKVEGRNFSSAANSETSPVNGTQKVEVMEGGKFLEARWHYDSEGHRHIGISIIGKDADNSKIKSHNFDNLGFPRVYGMVHEDGTWTLTGKTERSTLKFDNGGKSYKEFWEIKKNGTWQPLCERTGTKINV